MHFAALLFLKLHMIVFVFIFSFKFRMNTQINNYGLARSRDKLKPLYLHSQSVFSHHTWKDGDLP